MRFSLQMKMCLALLVDQVKARLLFLFEVGILLMLNQNLMFQRLECSGSLTGMCMNTSLLHILSLVGIGLLEDRIVLAAGGFRHHISLLGLSLSLCLHQLQ